MENTKYIGFVEANEHEGEDFGFYFPDTPENREALNSFKSLWEKLEADDVYELDSPEEAYSVRDLKMIEHGSGNTYMGRANIVVNPEKTLPLLLLIEKYEQLPYKGSFYIDNVSYDLNKDEQ